MDEEKRYGDIALSGLRAAVDQAEACSTASIPASTRRT